MTDSGCFLILIKNIVYIKHIITVYCLLNLFYSAVIKRRFFENPDVDTATAIILILRISFFFFLIHYSGLGLDHMHGYRKLRMPHDVLYRRVIQTDPHRVSERSVKTTLSLR